MNKNKSVQIILMVIFLMGAFTLIQKKIGKGLVYGYGYNSTIISVNTLSSTDGKPQLSGSYTGGPYNSIGVSVISKDSGLSLFAGLATDNNNGTWTLPVGVITNALPIGIYNVAASANYGGLDFTYDATVDELKIIADFSNISISSEIDDQRAKIKFKNTENVSKYMISKHKDFRNADWENASDHRTLKLDGDAGERKYYIKFKDITETESKVYTESFNYTPDRFIKNSKSSLKNGDKLTQSGKKFSKNSTVSLYFSNNKGGYYSPVIVETDSKGNFSTTYTINKPAGKYKWYAIDTKTEKKSKSISYSIRK